MAIVDCSLFKLCQLLVVIKFIALPVWPECYWGCLPMLCPLNALIYEYEDFELYCICNLKAVNVFAVQGPAQRMAS